MNRFALAIISVFIVLTPALSQELKRVEHKLPLLKTEGEEVFSFEISSLKEDTYKIVFEVKEYAKGALAGSVVSSVAFVKKNKMSEMISIEASPVADSLKTVSLSINNVRQLSRDLALKPLEGPGSRIRYHYDARPFRVGAVQLGAFTPLVLLGSFWFDEREGGYRFCGEKEFPADMSSVSLEKIPHYYVIGITITK